jgi:hypothetical protein
MGDDQADPIIEVLEVGLPGRWGEEKGDTVGGEDAGDTVTEVGGIAQDEINALAGRCQLGREEIIGLFRLSHGVVCSRVIPGQEMNPEVLGVEGSPVAGRAYLGGERSGEENECRREE